MRSPGLGSVMALGIVALPRVLHHHVPVRSSRRMCGPRNVPQVGRNIAMRFKRIDGVDSRGYGPCVGPDCSRRAGWVADSPAQDVIAYLIEENRTSGSTLTDRRLPEP